MRIKGKFGIKELRDFFIGLVLALIAALAIMLVFSVISLISWGVAWLFLAILLTPVGFWFVRFYREDITIEPIEEEEIESIIRFEGDRKSVV